MVMLSEPLPRGEVTIRRHSDSFATRQASQVPVFDDALLATGRVVDPGISSSESDEKREREPPLDDRPAVDFAEALKQSE